MGSDPPHASTQRQAAAGCKKRVRSQCGRCWGWLSALPTCMRHAVEADRSGAHEHVLKLARRGANLGPGQPKGGDAAGA